MNTSTYADKLEIAPGYTVGCWKNLKLDPDEPDSLDWQKAIKIFDARIRYRFLEPVDELIRIDEGRPRQTFGFAILALDFLVIETLQGFREGEINHTGKSGRLSKSFLTRWRAFRDCLPQDAVLDRLAEKLYRDYRCALHHSGATEGAMRVGVSGPVFHFESAHEIKINRTSLHKNVKCEFEAYLAELRAPDKSDLRRKFLEKMQAICGLPRRRT